MDVELLLLSAGLVLFLLLIRIAIILLQYSQYPTTLNLPPGQTGWPLFGETLEFLSMGRKGTPEKFVQDRMAKHSPHIFKTSLFGEKMAVFCGPAGNKFLFSNENKLVTSWWPSNVRKIFPPSPQSSTGDESIKLRKLLPGFLGPDSVRKYVAIMDSMARDHLERHWDNSSDNVITVLPLAHKYTFAVACRLFLSIDDPQHVARIEKHFHVFAAGVFTVPMNFPGTSFNRAIKASEIIRKEIMEIIRGRRQNTNGNHHDDDILAHMLTTPDDKGRLMTEQNVASQILGLLIGGHDTLSGAITFIVYYLADHPHIYHQVLEEQRRVAEGKAHGEELTWDDCQKMKYSWNVASEVLRVAAPLQGSFREAITDFTYQGFYIPKGFKLYWTTNSTHKNPEYFPEPEKFDPSRFDDRNGGRSIPYAYVPFGGGPRMCPGKDYARLEILAFVYNLVRMFKWEKVDPLEKMILNPLPMPENGLLVRLHRHN